jgi:hypothetical protein
MIPTAMPFRKLFIMSYSLTLPNNYAARKQLIDGIKLALSSI